MANSNVLKLPTAQDVELAKESSRTLSRYADDQLRIRVINQDEQSEDMVLPGYALDLLLDILTQISKGNAVSIIPVNAELTTQQAASLLNISRPHLIQLLAEKGIPYKMVGTHRRLLAKDVISYKEQTDKERLNALDELAAQAQELEMGYE